MPLAEDESKVVGPKDVALKMRLDYSHGLKDHSMRIIEDISVLCMKSKQVNLDTNTFLRETAEMVSRQFGIASVAIAMWDPAFRAYKFRVATGLGPEGVQLYKDLSFTKEEVRDDRDYPSYEISKQTRLYLSEDHPYHEGEESSFARPNLLGMKRRSLSDSLEADYLCVFIKGANDDTLGWIEVSGTRTRKLPDVASIKWIEMIACILGSVLPAR